MRCCAKGKLIRSEKIPPTLQKTAKNRHFGLFLPIFGLFMPISSSVSNRMSLPVGQHLTWSKYICLSCNHIQIPRLNHIKRPKIGKNDQKCSFLAVFWRVGFFFSTEWVFLWYNILFGVNTHVYRVLLKIPFVGPSDFSLLWINWLKIWKMYLVIF